MQQLPTIPNFSAFYKKKKKKNNLAVYIGGFNFVFSARYARLAIRKN
jgi:hypothetical protein